MPANKNALIRYKTIDRCLRNRYRRWTLEDLVEACSDPEYSISNTPITTDDYDLVVKAIEVIKEYKENGDVDKLDEVLMAVKDKLYILLRCG